MITKEIVANCKRHEVLKNVFVFFPTGWTTQEKKPMCVIIDGEKASDDEQYVDWLAFDNCFVFLAPAHKNSRLVKNYSKWVCNLAKIGDSYEDVTGRIYHVNVFYAYPQKEIDIRWRGQ